MSRVEEVSVALREAIKAKQAHRVAALRGIRAAFLHEMKKDNSDDLPEEVCVAVLRRLAKQRRESIEAFEQGGRPERADAERAELEVIEAYLPRLADETTTRAWVDAAVEQTGASGPRDLGKVMGALMKAHKDEVDGQLARRLASERLQG